MKRKEVQQTPEIVLVEVEMVEDENGAFDQHEEQWFQQPQIRRYTHKHLERNSLDFQFSFALLTDDDEISSFKEGK